MAAATVRSQTSSEGSLYELVARGVKDKYFLQDDKEAVHPFDWRYQRWPGSLPEERWTVPTNPARFGARCEFEFELPADVLVEAAIVIELPTWLPPEMAPNNLTTKTYEAGFPNRRYGYVNGIGYFLFERIEIYQDKVLLQEVSGDALYVAAMTRGSWNQALLKQQLAGCHDGLPNSIMHNATPGRLEILLPVPGCFSPGDKGLPLCGLRQQPFRLRLTLRPLEKLVECTDDLGVPPAPWTKSFTQETALATMLTAPAISRDMIGQPTLYLRTKQLYLLNDARKQLEEETIEVPYLRFYENIFNINQLDYAPINRGGLANIVKFLDATWTVEQVLTFFRAQKSNYLNRLWNFRNDATTTVINGIPTPTKGQFFTDIQFIIAGQLREGVYDYQLWNQVIPFFKEERTTGQLLLDNQTAPGIAIMNWSAGWRIEDTPPAMREPTGGINFSTADRPMLTVGLTDVPIDPQLGYKQTEMRSICIAWGLYRIRKGRGGLEYYN